MFGLVALAAPLWNAPMNDNSERDALITKAMAAATAAIPEASKDPERPTFHFHTPAQWMNDPNGPIFDHGWYHMYYQFNPYGDHWGHMHWGHARSRDLVNWEHLPVAIWPTLSANEDHIYSGSSFRDGNGQPVIVYTSISGKREPEQWIARPESSDLIHWTKSTKNPILSQANHGGKPIGEWRDPFLFSNDGQTYLVTGGTQDGKGIVALYRAKDGTLESWDYLGPMFIHPDANDVECPNIVKIGGSWVLLTSVHGVVEAFIGDLDFAKGHFNWRKRSILADGSYASQLLTEKGRHFHFAWISFDNHRGWNGCLALPSELSLDADDNLIRQPIPELAKLRGPAIHIPAKTIRAAELKVDSSLGRRLEVEATIDPGTSSRLTLRLLKDGNRNVEVVFDNRSHTLIAPGRAPIPVPFGKDGFLRLHVYLDGGIVDTYGQGGRVSLCSNFSMPSAHVNVSLLSEGGEAELKSMTVWPIKDATFDLSKFR